MVFLALLLTALSSGAPELGRGTPPCPVVTQTGYLKNTADQYLTCNNENCQWAAFSDTSSQLFHQEAGWRGQSQFAIYTPTGAPTGQCLNQFYNEAGTSGVRMANCELKGSKYWGLCKGQLAFDWMRYCVESNAGLSKCYESHEVVTMYAPSCIVTSTTIDNLECMSPITGGGCAATGFEANTMAGASSEDDCNACDSVKGSTQQCEFSFAYTTQNTITNTWSNSIENKLEVHFDVTENFMFGSAEEGMSYEFADTLTTGKSTSRSTTVQDSTGCSVTLPSGTRESATAQYLVGTIHSDFKATVTKHYTCNTGQSKQKSYNSTMTLTITNVPTQKIIGSCTTTAEQCSNGILPPGVPPPPPMGPNASIASRLNVE